jgi:hypothetical protein
MICAHQGKVSGFRAVLQPLRGISVTSQCRLLKHTG